MRLAVVIIALAAIAVGLVHTRRMQTGARHELQKLENQQIALKRQLQDQQVQLGWLTSPSEIHRKAAELALPMVERSKSSGELTTGSVTPAPPHR